MPSFSPSPKHCPVCGSNKLEHWAQATDLEYLTTDKVFHYFKCGGCGCLLIHPVPSHQLSRIYPPNYYSFTGDKLSLTEKAKLFLDRRFLKKILGRVEGSRVNVLDIGGGTGWMLDLVKSADPRVAFTQVVDLDPRAARVARQKGHTYFKGPIEAFSSSRRFHLVLMYNLIEHVKDPARVLRKIGNLMVPGGLLVLKTPNIDSWDARLFRHSNWGGYHCPRHWVLFDEKSFRRALLKTHLKLDSLAYTQGAPFWAQTVLMALRRRGLAHYTREKPLVRHPLFPFLAAFFAAFDFARGLFFKTSQMFILVQKPGKAS